MLPRKPCHDVALHVCRDRACFEMERVLLCRALQRMIDSGSGRKLGAANCRLQPCCPRSVCGIAKGAMHDVASNDTGSLSPPRHQSGGKTKADSGLAAFRNFLADELFEPAAIRASSNSSDLRESRGDARFSAKTGRGNDETWLLRLPAHIPTRTEVVLEVFRFR